jgi:N-hydroxyarylamine O-acetyltransferase
MTTVSSYAQRIGVDVSGRAPDLVLLRELQVAHMIAVPFENLHVFHRAGVRTGVDWSLPKVVEAHRGGWCFELNGAFGWLLRELGFVVDYVACSVFGQGAWGDRDAHCALVAHLDGRRWLVDVGFGDSSMGPVELMDGEHDAIPRPIRCTIADDEFWIAQLDLDGTWGQTLWGRFDPVELDHFSERSEFFQTEPGLFWTAGGFATRATAADGSRVILRDGVLRLRHGRGAFDDRPVALDEWPTLLLEHFGLAPTSG